MQRYIVIYKHIDINNNIQISDNNKILTYSLLAFNARLLFQDRIASNLLDSLLYITQR